MPETTHKGENAPTASEQGQGLDPRVKEALNTEGFVEFMAKHPDAAGEGSPDDETTLKRFEVFNTVGAVADGLKRLYAGEIKEQTGFDLDGAALDSIAAELEDQAISDPEKIIELNKKLNELGELPMQIRSLEGQLGSLGSAEAWADELTTAEALRGQVAIAQRNMTISGALEMLGDVTVAKETFAAGKALRTAGIDILHRGDVNVAGMELDKKIAGIETTLSGIRGASALKASADEMFGNLKKDLLSGMKDHSRVVKAVQAAAQSQLKKMVAGGELTSLDAAQKRLEELRQASVGSAAGVELLGFDQDKFQKALDKAIEDKASVEVMQAVSDMKLGNKSFDRLQAALKGFMSRQEFGSKKGEEARAQIEQTLSQIRDSQELTPEGKAKKILLQNLLATVAHK